MCWYPHANELLHHIEKCVISNNAINMHSRWPTEQHFCALEPHHGCLHKVKEVCSYPLIKKGQWSHNIGKWSRTPNYYTTLPYVKKTTEWLTSRSGQCLSYEAQVLFQVFRTFDRKLFFFYSFSRQQ